jgi:hypothetical protein
MPVVLLLVQERAAMGSAASVHHHASQKSNEMTEDISAPRANVPAQLSGAPSPTHAIPNSIPASEDVQDLIEDNAKGFFSWIQRDLPRQGIALVKTVLGRERADGLPGMEEFEAPLDPEEATRVRPSIHNWR